MNGIDIKNQKVISLTLKDLKEVIERFENNENMTEERTQYTNNTILRVMRE